jgi:formate hydrogenlyase subunit 4
MAIVLDAVSSIAQMLFVLLVAPGITGLVRKVKARLLLRQGPPILQPYRNLVRLLRKEAVVAENASWLFRAAPYLTFALTLVAAALVPTVATGQPFALAADLIAIIALLASARFFLALAGLDIGTSFGGIGSSREVMIASLAEPAMLMITFSIALIAGSTNLSVISQFMASQVSPEVSRALALVGFIMVAIAENARIPVDTPATHLELTMGHEAMVLEYSGRHLALIEWAASLKLLVFLSLLAAIFAPWGIATFGTTAGIAAVAIIAYLGKVTIGAAMLGFFEVSIAKMRVFRVPEFLGAALMLGLLATLLRMVVRNL